MLLIKVDELVQELTKHNVPEEQMTRALSFLQREFESLSSGIFLHSDDKYQLKIGRNISNTYTKNTIFHDEDSFIKELKRDRFISLKDSVAAKFEHQCRHILVNILKVRHEIYGFIFTEKETEYYTKEEESAFRIIAENTALFFSVGKLMNFISEKSELDENTHLFRYKSFMEKGTYLFKLLQPTTTSLSVAVLKINKYHDLVKVHGREQSQVIIDEILAAIQKNIRPIDIIGKIFDDTYALIFPLLTLKKAKKMVDRIHKELINNKKIMERNASWGIAGMEKSGGSFAQMISDAEEAAFDASRNAENPVMIYEE